MIAYRHLAILLATLSALGPFSIDTYLPSFPEIGSSLGASSLEVQQTLTAYLLPFAIMTLWHGAIADALGRRRVILAALAFFGLASLACMSTHIAPDATQSSTNSAPTSWAAAVRVRR